MSNLKKNANNLTNENYGFTLVNPLKIMMFKRSLLKIDIRLRGLSPLSFMLVMGILIYLPVIVSLPLYYYFPEGYNLDIPEEDNYIRDVIIFVIVAPLLETLVFQYGIIKLFRRLFKFNNIVLVFISSAIFGLGHMLFVTQIMAFLTGLLLAYSFVIYESKPFPAFWMVAILHIIRNIPIAF